MLAVLAGTGAWLLVRSEGRSSAILPPGELAPWIAPLAGAAPGPGGGPRSEDLRRSTAAQPLALPPPPISAPPSASMPAAALASASPPAVAPAPASTPELAPAAAPARASIQGRISPSRLAPRVVPPPRLRSASPHAETAEPPAEGREPAESAEPVEPVDPLATPY
jgi:hypothetical protein